MGEPHLLHLIEKIAVKNITRCVLQKVRVNRFGKTTGPRKKDLYFEQCYRIPFHEHLQHATTLATPRLCSANRILSQTGIVFHVSNFVFQCHLLLKWHNRIHM